MGAVRTKQHLGLLLAKPTPALDERREAGATGQRKVAVLPLLPRTAERRRVRVLVPTLMQAQRGGASGECA